MHKKLCKSHWKFLFKISFNYNKTEIEESFVWFGSESQHANLKFPDPIWEVSVFRLPKAPEKTNSRLRDFTSENYPKTEKYVNIELAKNSGEKNTTILKF